ncbi:hypothetical protein [Falsibacillus albus]|uniref:Lipoprotein n=1 Tax=Falsibacillus albus TaxID=2478915 RepID=A0A3L7K0E3_9BACI|nr:hypothetical protein [Falsibacillus albus]RLQ95859.1 hypothetical protein D9X91_09585 [Falsibacillus albus]
MIRIALLLSVMLLGGCQSYIPEKHGEINAKAQTVSQSSAKKMNVKHVVRGKDVFVECVISSISLNGKNPAKIAVYVDGRLNGDYQTAAFIIKGLPKGVHHIKLDLVNSNHSRYGVSKDFYVTIQ